MDIEKYHQELNGELQTQLTAAIEAEKQAKEELIYANRMMDEAYILIKQAMEKLT